MKTAEQGKTVVSGWGSDAIAALLRELGFEYIALNPGSSYRGLHDSIVNYLGNENPQMLLCLHEEHSVAIAQGYAKITGKPMLAVVHSNVGLMHASMAIFNAWCDRAPVLILGANGPIDAQKRRPWIDWIHTTQDMGNLVRNFTKWDDTPGSPGAAVDSILRAYQIASTLPHGPAIVFLDADVQEQKLSAPLALPPVAKYAPPDEPAPTPADVKRVLAALKGARHLVILAGRGARTTEAWDARVALAETLNAGVVTQSLTGATFPKPRARPCAMPTSSSISTASISPARSSRSPAANRLRQPSSARRWTATCIAAGTWITRACRHSISTSPHRPTRSSTNSLPSSAIPSPNPH
jgi:thiamine pyrophosphate-dependent acetolactate synthase large subunit-like protein